MNFLAGGMTHGQALALVLLCVFTFIFIAIDISLVLYLRRRNKQLAKNSEPNIDMENSEAGGTDTSVNNL